MHCIVYKWMQRILEYTCYNGRVMPVSEIQQMELQQFINTKSVNYMIVD